MRPVPTVRELAHRGLAYPIDWTRDGIPTRWRVTDEGHALLGKIMRQNGLEAQILGLADWTPPPGRSLPGMVHTNPDPQGAMSVTPTTTPPSSPGGQK